MNCNPLPVRAFLWYKRNKKERLIFRTLFFVIFLSKAHSFLAYFVIKSSRSKVIRLLITAQKNLRSHAHDR